MFIRPEVKVKEEVEVKEIVKEIPEWLKYKPNKDVWVDLTKRRRRRRYRFKFRGREMWKGFSEGEQGSEELEYIMEVYGKRVRAVERARLDSLWFSNVGKLLDLKRPGNFFKRLRVYEDMKAICRAKITKVS